MERQADDNNANANANADNININNINNANYYVDEVHNNHGDDNVPLAMHSNLLRMLYELRVPLYALGALGGGGGGAGGAGAYNDDDNDMEQAGAAAVLARSLYDMRPVKHVIDIADGETGEKHGIREITYNKETAEEMKINTACGIWQEEIEAGQAVKILPCNHAFDAEAVTKWLTTEKAECPMCRFKLESKEVIVRPSEGDDNDMPVLMSDDDSDADDMPPNHHPVVQPPQPPVDEQRARENNIMYRQNNIIYDRAHGGGAADMGRDHRYGVSMPMNRLLQMRARLVHGARAGGGAVGAVGAVGAGAASVGGYQPPQPSQNNPHHVVTNINNNYSYNYYINPINRYQISVEEQEQSDIEEAIRRSLE